MTKADRRKEEAERPLFRRLSSRIPPFVPEDSKVLFSRELPGGGEVRVETVAVDDAGAEHGARVVVERRSDPRRRDSHAPPIIAEATSADSQGLVDRLVRIARDNVAIARALQRWQRKEPPA